MESGNSGHIFKFTNSLPCSTPNQTKFKQKTSFRKLNITFFQLPTSLLSRGRVSREILLFSSFTGIKGLKNLGGCGENALNGLIVVGYGLSGTQPLENKKTHKHIYTHIRRRLGILTLSAKINYQINYLKGK